MEKWVCCWGLVAEEEGLVVESEGTAEFWNLATFLCEESFLPSPHTKALLLLTYKAKPLLAQREIVDKKDKTRNHTWFWNVYL